MSQNRHHHSSGEIIHSHRHDEHQLIYVARGVLAIETEQGAWVASADRAIWIPAHSRHAHRAYGDTIVHTVMFPTTESFPGTSPFSGESPTLVGVSALLRELLIACTDPELALDENKRIRAVLSDRLRGSDARALTLPIARDSRLADACQIVVNDLSQPRSMTWLASRVGTSERTLARLFRSEFGTTYPQWRTNTRVFHAMIRLSEGATVTEAAHQCGWATASAFIDTFTRTMGQTPGSYRSISSGLL